MNVYSLMEEDTGRSIRQQQNRQELILKQTQLHKADQKLFVRLKKLHHQVIRILLKYGSMLAKRHYWNCIGTTSKQSTLKNTDANGKLYADMYTATTSKNRQSLDIKQR